MYTISSERERERINIKKVFEKTIFIFTQVNGIFLKEIFVQRLLPHAPPGRPVLLLVQAVEVGVDGTEQRLHDVVAKAEVELLALGPQNLLALRVEVVHHVQVGHHNVQLVEVAHARLIVRAREHGDDDVLVLVHQDVGEGLNVRVAGAVRGLPVRGDDDQGGLLADDRVLLPEDALEGVSEWGEAVGERSEVLLHLLVAGDTTCGRAVQEVDVDAVLVEDGGDFDDDAHRLLQLIPASADRGVGVRVLARVDHRPQRAGVVGAQDDLVVEEDAEERNPVRADLEGGSELGKALHFGLHNVKWRCRGCGYS